jgi:hypothetical protein
MMGFVPELPQGAVRVPEPGAKILLAINTTQSPRGDLVAFLKSEGILPEYASSMEVDAECTCGPELPEPKKSDNFPSEPSARSLSKVLASISRVRHIDGLPITVRTTSCNRRHEDNRSLSGERAEDEGSTLEENERA